MARNKTLITEDYLKALNVNNDLQKEKEHFFREMAMRKAKAKETKDKYYRKFNAARVNAVMDTALMLYKALEIPVENTLESAISDANNASLLNDTGDYSIFFHKLRFVVKDLTDFIYKREDIKAEFRDFLDKENAYYDEHKQELLAPKTDVNDTSQVSGND